MLRPTHAPFWIFLLLAFRLAAQAPSFEVASIRPSNFLVTPALPCNSLKLSSESVLASGYWRLSDVIWDAYRDQVDDFDLPAWTSYTGTFAVSVKIPPNTSVATCRKMLQNLLAERFHLVTAIEIREVSRYYLKVAKSGLKLQSVSAPADPIVPYTVGVQNGRSHFTFRSTRMSEVVRGIAAVASSESRARGLRDTGNVDSFKVAGVVDETGLTGYYDGQFEFDVAASLHSEMAESLEDALPRQLGLSLELRKAPGRVLIIRSSDRMPTEN